MNGCQFLSRCQMCPKTKMSHSLCAAPHTVITQLSCPRPGMSSGTQRPQAPQMGSQVPSINQRFLPLSGTPLSWDLGTIQACRNITTTPKAFHTATSKALSIPSDTLLSAYLACCVPRSDCWENVPDSCRLRYPELKPCAEKSTPTTPQCDLDVLLCELC